MTVLGSFNRRVVVNLYAFLGPIDGISNKIKRGSLSPLRNVSAPPGSTGQERSAGWLSC